MQYLSFLTSLLANNNQVANISNTFSEGSHAAMPSNVM